MLQAAPWRRTPGSGAACQEEAGAARAPEERAILRQLHVSERPRGGSGNATWNFPRCAGSKVNWKVKSVKLLIGFTEHWDQMNVSWVPIHEPPLPTLASSIANSISLWFLMFVSPKTTGTLDRAAAELAAMQLWMTLVRPVRLKACALQDTFGKRWSASVD